MGGFEGTGVTRVLLSPDAPEAYAAGYRAATLFICGRAAALRLRGLYACAAYGGSREVLGEELRLLLARYPALLTTIGHGEAATSSVLPYAGGFTVSADPQFGARTTRDPRPPGTPSDGSRLVVAAPGATYDLTTADGHHACSTRLRYPFIRLRLATA